MILTHKDPMTWLALGVKDARGVRRFIRENPDAPFCKRGKTWFTVDSDLEQFMRRCDAFRHIPLSSRQVVTQQLALSAVYTIQPRSPLLNCSID